MYKIHMHASTTLPMIFSRMTSCAGFGSVKIMVQLDPCVSYTRPSDASTSFTMRS